MNIQKLETIQIPKEEAEEKWKELIVATKKHQSQHLKDLQKVYYHIKRSGKRVMDVFLAIKAAGLHENGDPNLAICKADATVCYARKESNGAIVYGHKDSIHWGSRTKEDVLLPSNTFTFPSERPNETWSSPTRKDIKTSVPIVPAEYLPQHHLKNYYILWDVEKWELHAPRDPILLKRLTSNLFMIEAKWNLTKLERAVIRGRL